MLEEIYQGNKLFYSVVKRMLEYDEKNRPSFEDIKIRLPSRLDIEDHFDKEGDIIPSFIANLIGNLKSKTA